MACCGRTCSISVDNGTAFEGYITEINDEGQRIDVTKFEDTKYGSWLTDCTVNGTVMLQSYVDSGVSVGDTNDLSITVCGTTYTTAGAGVLTKTVHVEATGVPYFTTTWAVNAAIVGF